MRSPLLRSHTAAIFLFSMASCAAQEDGNAANEVAAANAAAPAAAPPLAFAWPGSLRPFGDGYPEAGAPCRRIGESPAVSDWLDDSADLVGCPPDGEPAKTIVEGRRGRIVGTVDGVTLLSVPRGDSGPADGQRGAGDALVAGTGFNATGTIRCVTAAGAPAGNCDAGVVRDKDGSAALTITWPDRRIRTLFFDRGGKVSGADTNQADGSARYQVRGVRESDTIVVTIGPERYEVPEVFVEGD